MNYWNKRHDKSAYRSGLEDTISLQLKGLGISVQYETHVIRYTVPESQHRYTPDFVLPNGIIVETKGRFTPADRRKMAHVVSQHPELDIRIVFNNERQRIAKNSKTTYADWCDKHKIKHASKQIPREWLDEPPNRDALNLLTHLLKKTKAPKPE